MSRFPTDDDVDKSVCKPYDLWINEAMPCGVLVQVPKNLSYEKRSYLLYFVYNCKNELIFFHFHTVDSRFVG